MKGKEFDTKNSPICFVDLEMTGLEAKKHEIVEIGVVKATQPGLKIIETWDVKIRPEHLETADPKALEISGYNPEGWKNAISLKEMMEILTEKTKGTVLAGFVPFADYSFLDAAVTKTGIPLRSGWKNAISLKEMMEILTEKTKGTVLAGFVPFADYSFLDAAVTKTGIPLDFHSR